MSTDPMKRFLEAINNDVGLRDEVVYHIEFEDYRCFPDPFPRTTFSVKEVQASIRRYPNPEKPGERFRWDIHGTLLTPDKASLPDVAVAIIHGGAANEYEFLFTPDGPETYLDLTKVPPGESRAGIAQHIASLGVKVLAISLPGHYSSKPWPPIAVRKPEFVIGETPDDVEMRNRLGVYTFRMCLEAVKVLIEQNLARDKLYVWGHSTGGEFFFLLEQYGAKNTLLGGLGFGSGMPGSMMKEFDHAVGDKTPEERANQFRPVNNVTRRSPEAYRKAGYVGPNQPWASPEKWFELVSHRRVQLKPNFQDIEHHGQDMFLDEFRRATGLPDEELFICNKADLTRLRGKKILYFVGKLDKEHWNDHRPEFGRELYAIKRLVKYADKARLVVIPQLTHYGHIESHNERLANMMVTALRDYFPHQDLERRTER